MMKPVIEVKNVTKFFNYWEEKPDNLKKILTKIIRFKFEFGRKQTIQVLEDVTFTVHQGDFIGFMGRNGVGKSTLMKIISGIYFPNKGEVKIHGRIAPLIELGAGFVGELSGYENIFINSSILGFSRKQTLDRIQEIIGFSELAEKIHMPVKNYSSGMALRLGFSIAVHMDAPILLFDEVLGVGDAGFQKKCIDKIHELHAQGRTIVLVTHSPEQVIQFCNRALIFNERKLIFDGTAAEGAKVYQSLF